ncbi:MAG TPA: hypothetical protein VHZ51_10110 [Ktedonobacteraceae bacterium]|jgi:hypothetical protein|nr:hypothetical protein [Ktedonobacteraceae bacterium]
MTVELNTQAFEHAKQLIEQGKFVFDDRDMWSEHQPSEQAENEYLKEHGFDEYGKWFLGIDTEHHKNTKGRYKFPYGDFEKVHRGGVISAESRAGQYKYVDIEHAAHQLHKMIDAATKRKK